MTLYDVLGVRVSATADELRAAYLAAARRAHPDVAGPSGEDRMREVNSAWSVLGDPRRRAEYDLTLPAGPAASPGATSPTGARVSRPADRPFVPYHAVDEDDDDAWRYTDDETDPETAPGAFLQMAPVVLVALGVLVGMIGGLVVGFRVAVLGLALVGVGLLGFLFVPLAVMARASDVEQQRARQRER